MEKGNIVKLVLAGVALFLVLLISSIPARLVLGHAGKAAPGMFYADGIQGTIWTGSASSILVNAQGNILDLGKGNWKLSALPLLWGTVSIELNTSGEQSINTQASIGTSSVSLEATDLALPATVIAKYLPIPVRIDGNINLHLDEFEFAYNDMLLNALQGVFLWEDAQIDMTGTPSLLGTYKAELSRSDNGAAIAKISDNQALLGVTGTVKLQPQKKAYVIDVNIKPQQGLDPMLAQMIPQLGRTSADGSVLLQTSGTL